MYGLLKKFLIPHESNGFHPHIFRHHQLLTFALLFFIANYVVFPFLGINNSKASASSITSDELVNYANIERQKLGLTPVSVNAKLISAAKAKAQDMFSKQYWDHFGPNGETPWQFIKQYGYEYVTAGENLAKNFQVGKEVHEAWMNSPTHKANIINSNFRDIGIAVVPGTLQGENTILIVQMFGSTDAKTTAITNSTQQQTKPQPTTAKKPIKAPQILEPQNISYTNKDSVTLKGTAEEGKSLIFYSNNKKIGELPRNGAAFTVNADIKEDNNSLYLTAKDGSNESQPSNTVKVLLDKVNPDFKKVSINFESNDEKLLISLVSPEQLAAVSYSLGGLEGNFEKNDGVFTLLLKIQEARDKNFEVTLTDLAENTSTEKVDIQGYLDKKENEKVLGVVASTASTGGKFSQIVNAVKTAPLSKKIDFSAIIFLLILIIIDAAILYKKGIKRVGTSFQPFNVAIFLLLVVAMVVVR